MINNNNKVNFKGVHYVDLTGFSEKAKFDISSKIGEQIGNGFEEKIINHNGTEISHDIFVSLQHIKGEMHDGATKDGVMISTDADSKFMQDGDISFLKSKLESIDIPILNKVGEILESFGIKKPDEHIKSSDNPIDGLLQSNGESVVFLTKDHYDNLLAHQYEPNETAYYYFNSYEVNTSKS